MTDLIFYTSPNSRGRIVRCMLEECGAHYQTSVMQYGSDAPETGMKSPDYLSINPMGKVPALSYAGKVVTEVAAIIMFLAEIFPEAGLAPPVTERQAYYRWILFAAGPFEAAITNKALGVEVSAEQQAFVGYGTVDMAINTLANAVSKHPWLCGEQYTAADVYVGSLLQYAVNFGFCTKTTELGEYLERLHARKGFQEAARLDNELAAAQA